MKELHFPRHIKPTGFEIPKYTYKGMPIYTSEEVPENEIHLYDTLTGKITILQLPKEDDGPDSNKQRSV